MFVAYRTVMVFVGLDNKRKDFAMEYLVVCLPGGTYPLHRPETRPITHTPWPERQKEKKQKKMVPERVDLDVGVVRSTL